MQINFIINRIYKHRMNVEIAILILWCLSWGSAVFVCIFGPTFGFISIFGSTTMSFVWIIIDYIPKSVFKKAHRMQSLCTIYGNEASCNLT